MLPLFLQSVPTGAIRDTISRIVLERGYRRTVTSTLFSRIWDWVTRVIRDLFEQAAGSRGTYLITLTVLACLLSVFIARSVIVARARRRSRLHAVTAVTADAQLAQARGLAAQGAYVEAAHLLHAAIITRLAELRRVRPHPSKTVGDYWRELRTAGDALASSYRGFAQVYDIVAYGDGLCDTIRYARLEQLAAPVFDVMPPSTDRVRADTVRAGTTRAA